ncbi:meiotic recombination protein [Neoconidiobolus thromboides FSU 785]|nr:meiotic recombination protein [Neoconidiobolus thromboides FSU 785]
MSKLNPNKWPIEDTIKIMVATDNHLGYNETDSIRSEDSFIAFEEILKLAVEEKVDFILLGGDLFHDNKPSRNTMYKTIELLRKYCYGDKPSSLKFLSNQHINFKNNFGRANYLDPNLNISTPIFSIHGNHDDPAGLGGYCALDLLSMSGHINYFGRANGVDDILIHPILLQKGTTKLSLYGLGNVRDERLLKTFKKNKVRAVRPSQSPEEWFNLMVVHQNRQPHTVNKTDYLPEDQLFPFIDLVIWGHEHDCLIEPQLNPNKGFYVMQPGSSVATSLSEGESIRKHVAILKIHGTKFHVDKIPLKSIRPFKFLDLILEEFPEMELKSEERTMEILKNEVTVLLLLAATQAKKEWLELNQDVDEVNCPLPLVRLRVELGLNMESISTMNFINKFNGIIANPKDPIRFKRKKINLDILKRTKGINSLTQSLSQSSAIPTSKVEDLLIEILNDSEPAFLPCPHMTETLKYFVDKEEKNAIEE